MPGVHKKKSSRGLIVVGGLMFHYPVPGVAWQHLHYLIGLQNLGWDVYYIEDGYWHSHLSKEDGTPLDIADQLKWSVKILERYGFKDRWHYNAIWEDRSFGIERAAARKLLQEADIFLNVCGGQMLTEDHMKCPQRILIETDPVEDQIKLAKSDARTIAALRDHTSLFTFGENLGTEACSLTTGGFTWNHTRQPVLLDEWMGPKLPPVGAAYTTVGNWEAKGKDVEFAGKIYHWQKSLEFIKIRELPQRVNVTIRLAMGFNNPADRQMMESYGWQTKTPIEVSSDLDAYREFIQSSRAEFTVAKEQNIVFKTGWFSDRAATYLAAGRPVINQDTGFSRNLPVGEGLFSFNTLQECITAIETIEADYARASRAATEIAHEYFAAKKVLSSVLERAGNTKP